MYSETTMPKVGDLIGTSLQLGTDLVFDENGDVIGDIRTDTINEKTAAAGVTIDGVLLKDSAVSIGGNQVVAAQGTAVANAAAATAASLTDNSSGTASQTIVTSAGANPTQAEFNNNMASLTDEINKLITDVGDIRSQLNTLLARLRTHGLIAT